MNFEEYQSKKNLILKENEERLKKLDFHFAMSNNPHNIGDKIKDHIGTIIIKEIGWHRNMGSKELPACCVYTGDNLTKKGTINKKEPIRTVYQTNIIKPESN